MQDNFNIHGWQLKTAINELDETEKIKGKDGKGCWKGYRYAGTENGKDKCVPVKEGEIGEIVVTPLNITGTPLIRYKTGDLAKAYYQDLLETNQLIGQKTEDYLSLIIRMPEIYIQSKDAVSAEEFAFVEKLVDEACTNLTTFRRQEGIALEKEFSERIGEIRSLLNQVEPFETSRIEIVKERIRKGL